MAVTTTKPAASTEVELATDLPELLPLPGGLAGVLGSGDHKTIGRLYIGFGLLFGLAAAAAGALADLGQVTEMDFPPEDVVTQLTYFRPVAVVFMFLMAVTIGLATYVVPLQVGSRTVAFPRAAAAGFWAWLVSSGIVVTCYAMNGGPEGGVTGAGEVGTSLFLVAFLGVIASLLLTTVCIVVTVFGLRTPGMTLLRVPLFSWSMVVAGGIWLLSLPVLMGLTLLMFVDFQYGGRTSFGAPTQMWDQLGWFSVQPQIYAFAIPVLGIVGDIVPTFSRTRTLYRGGMMSAIATFGALSFGAWASPSLNEDVYTQAAFVSVAVAIVVPILAILVGWAGVVRKGKLSVSGAMVGALVSLVLLLLAAVAGAAFAIEPLEVQNASWQLGQSLLVVYGAAAGAAAGIVYWAPKIWGHRSSDGLAKLAAPLFLVAGLLAAVPQLILGLSERIDSVADSADALNTATAAGDAVGFIAILLVGMVVLSSLRGSAAGDDPWEGQTLEWSIPSPPPRGNFGEIALVTSPEPVLDAASAGKESS